MSAIKKLARSKKAALLEARSLSITDLKRTIAHLSAALLAKEASEIEKRANIKKVKAIMTKMGLSHDDLREAKEPVARKMKKASTSAGGTRRGPQVGRKVKPKYALKRGKKVHRWTGRGRMPIVFKEFVESGGKMDECLIRPKKSSTS